jgi:hypothetical protein
MQRISSTPNFAACYEEAVKVLEQALYSDSKSKGPHVIDDEEVHAAILHMLSAISISLANKDHNKLHLRRYKEKFLSMEDRHGRTKQRIENFLTVDDTHEYIKRRAREELKAAVSHYISRQSEQKDNPVKDKFYGHKGNPKTEKIETLTGEFERKLSLWMHGIDAPAGIIPVLEHGKGAPRQPFTGSCNDCYDLLAKAFQQKLMIARILCKSIADIDHIFVADAGIDDAFLHIISAMALSFAVRDLTEEKTQKHPSDSSKRKEENEQAQIVSAIIDLEKQIRDAAKTELAHAIEVYGQGNPSSMRQVSPEEIRKAVDEFDQILYSHVFKTSEVAPRNPPSSSRFRA